MAGDDLPNLIKEEAEPTKSNAGVPLRRMLLLSVGGLLMMLLLGNAVLNVVSSRHYLQTQMQSHAEDAATALGMSLSAALSQGDEVTASMVIDAIFDRGYYEHVILWDAKEKPWIVRHDNEMPEVVPHWFVDLMELEGKQAIADVTSGWKILGAISVKVHPGFMYEKLWQSIRVELAWFALVLILSLIALLFVIRRTTGPIHSLVNMAVAIGNGDFSVRATPSGAREIRKLATAMENMASRIQRMTGEQVDQIESLRSRLHVDAITGAFNREEFDRRLLAFLETRDGVGQGQLILVQFSDFSQFNNVSGRAAGDQLLEKIYLQLKSRCQKVDGFLIGRRTGADFVCFLPGTDSAAADKVAESIVKAITGLREVRQLCRDDIVHAGVVGVMPGNALGSVLANVDIALRNAQNAGNNGWKRFHEESNVLPLDAMHNANEWRETLLTALQDDTIVIHYQPVFATSDEHVVYCKALSRIDFGDELVNAGVFMPMAERFGLVGDLDKAVITKVIRYLDEVLHYGMRVGVSVSIESVQDDKFIAWLQAELSSHPAAAHCLYIEISEFALQRDTQSAEKLILMAAQTGLTVIIDQFGQSSLPFSYLQSLPLKWIKFDRSLIQGIDDKEDGRFYIQSITQIAHSQGVRVIGVGIESHDEWLLLKDLGVDAGAGYSLQTPLSDISGIEYSIN